MPASTDYFTYVGNPGTATSLAAPGHSISGTSITVGSTANWPTGSGCVFAIDTVTLVNGVQVRDSGSYTEWEGVVTSGTTIGSMVLRLGTDQNYPAGSTTRVYIPVASSRENRMVDGLLVAHDQDGTLKAGAVDNAAALASNVVTTAKILDANVTAAKLATTTRKADLPIVSKSTATLSASWPAASDQSMVATFVVPDDYVSGDLTAKILLEGPTSLVCSMYRLVYRKRIGTASLTIDNVVISNVSMGAGANLWSFTILAANFTAGDTIKLELHRDGLSGADTSSTDADYVGGWVEYLGRS